MNRGMQSAIAAVSLLAVSSAAWAFSITTQLSNVKVENGNLMAHVWVKICFTVEECALLGNDVVEVNLHFEDEDTFSDDDLGGATTVNVDCSAQRQAVRNGNMSEKCHNYDLGWISMPAATADAAADDPLDEEGGPEDPIELKIDGTGNWNGNSDSDESGALPIAVR